ncbi:hypothetical protein IWQ60_005370 [Tieghemiomyces parasiticus]|uniref:Uncharacterized protein n=1 Tax=Tieghemiomyces parasiticus TaxID=78921 RepID=A0A9W8A996_9FUNG|nr:hypothetical protein IWQ60_005370 [Tieghemiomyces parasiticus]
MNHTNLAFARRSTLYKLFDHELDGAEGEKGGMIANKSLPDLYTPLTKCGMVENILRGLFETLDPTHEFLPDGRLYNICFRSSLKIMFIFKLRFRDEVGIQFIDCETYPLAPSVLQYQRIVRNSEFASGFFTHVVSTVDDVPKYLRSSEFKLVLARHFLELRHISEDIFAIA